jgi:hypothetical protein
MAGPLNQPCNSSVIASKATSPALYFCGKECRRYSVGLILPDCEKNNSIPYTILIELDIPATKVISNNPKANRRRKQEVEIGH